MIIVDLKALFATRDTLKPDELDRLHQGWIVRPENIAAIETILRSVHEQAALMTDEEIDSVIDEAIADVRRK